MNPLLPQANHQFDSFTSHPEPNDVDISDMDGIDWSNNSDPFGMFSSRGLAAPKMLSPADIRREAKESTSKIFKQYHFLQDILARHEAKIQKRWGKKTKTQKLAILLKAWPEMPATHRPDFNAFRNSSSRNTAKYRNSYILPYVNQEDLAKPETFLLLLNSRGKNHPSVFAAADGQAMHIGLVTMAVVPIFLNCYVMILNGMTQEEEYG